MLMLIYTGHLLSDGPMRVEYFHAWDLDKNGKLTLEEVWSLTSDSIWDWVLFHFCPYVWVIIKIHTEQQALRCTIKKSKVRLLQYFKMLFILNLRTIKRVAERATHTCSDQLDRSSDIFRVEHSFYKFVVFFNQSHFTSPIRYVIFLQLMAYAKKYQYLILTREDTLEM